MAQMVAKSSCVYQLPGGSRSVEPADERRQVVGGRARVVAASRGPAGHGIETVREGRSLEGAEPAVADAEALCEEVVDRQLLTVVVPHDDHGLG